MQLQEFTALPESQQKDMLRLRAAYLAKRTSGELVYFLFQLDDFYIEVPFHRSRNKVGAPRCFRSMRLLDAYLGSMHVKHVS